MNVVERGSLAAVIAVQLVIVSIINILALKKFKVLDDKMKQLRADYEAAREINEGL